MSGRRVLGSHRMLLIQHEFKRWSAFNGRCLRTDNLSRRGGGPGGAGSATRGRSTRAAAVGWGRRGAGGAGPSRGGPRPRGGGGGGGRGGGPGERGTPLAGRGCRSCPL